MPPSMQAPAPSVSGPLTGFYLLAFGALGIHAPYFPLWLDAHGISGIALSSIAALVPALSFVGPPLIGALSDARGARGNWLIWICGFAATGMLGLCIAEALSLTHLFWLVFAGAFAYALCRSPMILLVDRIALEHGGNYGRRRLWGSIGFMLAAAGYGRFAPTPAWRWLPGVLALVMAAAAVASWALPRQAGAGGGRALGAGGTWLGQRRSQVFLVCCALFSASHSSIDLCGSLYFRDLGGSGPTIGALWGTGVIAEILLMGALWGQLRTARSEVLLLSGYLGGGLRWLLTAALPSAELAFAVQPLHALSFALVWLASLEHLQRTAAPQTFGSAQGWMMAANATGGVIGMLMWGPLYAARGGADVFFAATLLALGAAALAYVALYRRRPTGVLDATAS